MHSRLSSWKVSSKASTASDFATPLRIKQLGENENDAIRNRISDFDKRRIQATYFSTKNPYCIYIAGMDALSLNYWLSKFVMEVAKKSGGRYPPKPLFMVDRKSVV